MIAVVPIEIVVLLREIRHEEAEPAVVQVVAERDAHAALLGAVFADRDAGRKRHLLERPILVVAVQKIRRRIVRDVQVRPPVAVVIEPGDAEPEVAVRIGHARLLRYVGEVAVAVVVKENIRFARKSARAALHGDAAVLARLVPAEIRQMIEIDFDVAADEQIEPAVPIVIGEAAACGPAPGGHTGLLGDVRERAVMVVAVEPIPAQGGDVEVFPAVTVDIGRAHAHAPTGMSDSRLVSHVLEFAGPQIPIERAARRGRPLRGVHGQRIHEVHIDQAVVVEIEQRDAAAHRLDDVPLVRRGVMLEGDAGFRGDVVEQRHRRRRGIGKKYSDEERRDGHLRPRHRPAGAGAGLAVQPVATAVGP